MSGGYWGSVYGASHKPGQYPSLTARRDSERRPQGLASHCPVCGPDAPAGKSHKACAEAIRRGVD